MAQHSEGLALRFCSEASTVQPVKTDLNLDRFLQFRRHKDSPEGYNTLESIKVLLEKNIEYAPRQNKTRRPQLCRRSLIG